MPIVLPPGGIPDCESQAVAATTTTSAVNGPAPEKRRAVVVRDGGLPTVRHQVVDRQGRPVNLRDCTGVAAGGSVGSEGLEAGTDPVLVLRIREAISGVVTSFPAAVVTNGSDGWVQAAAVNLAALGGPGIFDAEFGLVVTGGTVLVVGAPFALVVEAGLFGNATVPGPPSIAELRLHLRDSSPSEHTLLDSVTFDDAEMALALRRPVDYFNEALPPVSTGYTTQNFPSRYNWCEGAVATLFFLLAEHYRKNRLAVAAGGMTVDDMDKEQQYGAEAQRRWAEYKQWVQSTKGRMSSDEAWGSAGGAAGFDYGYGYGRGSGWC